MGKCLYIAIGIQVYKMEISALIKNYTILSNYDFKGIDK